MSSRKRRRQRGEERESSPEYRRFLNFVEEGKKGVSLSLREWFLARTGHVCEVRDFLGYVLEIVELFRIKYLLRIIGHQGPCTFRKYLLKSK